MTNIDTTDNIQIIGTETEKVTNYKYLGLTIAKGNGTASSSTSDVMVALTRSFLPRVPHIWMSGTNPLQTPRAWF